MPTMTLERIGPYRIIRLLGKGGMGAVYEAVHEAIERRVAIKVLHAELGRRTDIATRFFNEARAVNRIEHPGLVQISDYGQLPDGMAYIVMEYLKGETLGQRLKRVTKMGAAEVIRLGRQICTALAAAHEKDIVHRGPSQRAATVESLAHIPEKRKVRRKTRAHLTGCGVTADL